MRTITQKTVKIILRLFPRLRLSRFSTLITVPRIIIGKECKDIKESESDSHIFGYCLVNDISEREWQIEKLGQWVKGKSHDTYGPIGPYIVTKDEIKDINNLNLFLDLIVCFFDFVLAFVTKTFLLVFEVSAFLFISVPIPF